jgi:hypothetical protein
MKNCPRGKVAAEGANKGPVHHASSSDWRTTREGEGACSPEVYRALLPRRYADRASEDVCPRLRIVRPTDLQVQEGPFRVDLCARLVPSEATKARISCTIRSRASSKKK